MIFDAPRPELIVSPYADLEFSARFLGSAAQTRFLAAARAIARQHGGSCLPDVIMDALPEFAARMQWDGQRTLTLSPERLRRVGRADLLLFDE